MSEPAIIQPDSARDRADSLMSRADSLICPESMERARAWIEEGLQSSLDTYRLMGFADLIEAFPGGRSMMRGIAETADRLDPEWLQGSAGERHIDYVAFRLREACEACLAAQAASDKMATERAKYLAPGLADATIDGILREALGGTISESDHLRTLQNACPSLRDAIRRASDDPADIGEYVRDITNICQHWRSRVRNAAQYLHRSLPALRRLASGDSASAAEVANMAIMERLMDDYAEARLEDPNDPSNDPDLAARKSKALQRFLAEHQPERPELADAHTVQSHGQPQDRRP